MSSSILDHDKILNIRNWSWSYVKFNFPAFSEVVWLLACLLFSLAVSSILSCLGNKSLRRPWRLNHCWVWDASKLASVESYWFCQWFKDQSRFWKARLKFRYCTCIMEGLLIEYIKVEVSPIFLPWKFVKSYIRINSSLCKIFIKYAYAICKQHRPKLSIFFEVF